LPEGSADEDPGRKRRLVRDASAGSELRGRPGHRTPPKGEGQGWPVKPLGARMPIERPAWGSDGRTRGRQFGGLERLLGEDRREMIRRQPVRAARFWWRAVGDTADGNPGSDAQFGPCGRVSRASTAIGSGGERTRNFRRLSRENRERNSGRSRTEAEEEVRTRGHSEPFFFSFQLSATSHLEPATRNLEPATWC